MDNELAELFYQSDIIQIKTGELQVNFNRCLLNPKYLRPFSNICAQILDDYAIDSITCIDEGLPIASFTAEALDLPLLWIRENSIQSDFATEKNIKRTMFLTLLTPSSSEIETVTKFFETSDIELVGIFSLLTVTPPEDVTTRLIELISLERVLQVYRTLFLITEDEFQKIQYLQNES